MADKNAVNCPFPAPLVIRFLLDFVLFLLGVENTKEIFIYLYPFGG